MSTSSTDRIDQLALVWLMVPRKESPVSGLAAQLKSVALPKHDQKQLANESIARLRERGMLEPGKTLQLTAAGRRSAAEILGNARPPKDKITLQWAKKVLLLRSMGVVTTSGDKGDRVGDMIAAAILARRYKVDRNVGGDPSSVLAVLARRALGLDDTATPLDLYEAFAEVFMRGHSPTPLDEASAKGHNGQPGPAVGTVLLRLEHCGLREFAQRVTEAARSSASGRWHGAVFISHVWSTLQSHGDVGITFEKFKRRLIEAHQQDLIELSRADLVDAMSPADVSASETVHSGARFHFVRPEQFAS